MKKVAFLIIIVMSALIVTSGYAQVKSGSVHITPTIGMYKFEGNEDMNTNLTIGLRAGYNFTKYIGVEGYGHWVPTQMTYYDQKVDFLGYGIDALFHILPDGAFVPFVAVGVGGTYYSKYSIDTTGGKDNKFAADYGAGVKCFLSDNFALRADVRHVIPFSSVNNNLLATIGFTVAFGGAKPAPPPEPPAPVAKCPDTPAGVPVDKDGCPLDSDQDGVPDYLDKCPATPADVVVDKEGCPLDSDRDGVYDYLDKCPGTPAGQKVDKNGCPEPVLQQVKPQAAAAPEIIEKGRTTLNVLFDTNKADIRKNSLKDVELLIGVMKDHPELTVVIEGHTDNIGNAAYNKKLSQKRADAVKKYMVEKGIDAGRIKTQGFGLEKPIADNATNAGRAKNRRVEAAVEYVIRK